MGKGVLQEARARRFGEAGHGHMEHRLPCARRSGPGGAGSLAEEQSDSMEKKKTAHSGSHEHLPVRSVVA